MGLKMLVAPKVAENYQFHGAICALIVVLASLTAKFELLEKNRLAKRLGSNS
jgi:hypothetical protein